MYLHINIADNDRSWAGCGGGAAGGAECNNETKGRSTYEAWVNSRRNERKKSYWSWNFHENKLLEEGEGSSLFARKRIQNGGRSFLILYMQSGTLSCFKGPLYGNSVIGIPLP